MNARSIKGLMISLLIVVAVSALGGWATSLSVTRWYPTLVKPPLTPPDWVFAPVWSLLYLMMGIAAWRVWRQAQSMAAARLPLSCYMAQLTLNLLWSTLFFALESPLLGLIDILALNLVLWMTIRQFHLYDRTAARLLIPYALWVGFATYLNAGICYLNK